MDRCQHTGCRRTARYTVALLVTRWPTGVGVADARRGSVLIPGQYERGEYCELHAIEQTIDPRVWMRPLPAYADVGQLHGG